MLKVSSSDEGTLNFTHESRGFTSQSRIITTETVRIPLAKVNVIYLSNWGTSQALSVSNSGDATLAGLTTQARFPVSVYTVGEEAVSEHSITRTTDSFGSKPTKFVVSGKKGFGTICTFQTRAQAVQFARQLHDLVAMLRKGKPLSLKLEGM